MNPHKSKKLIPRVASQKDYSEELVKDLIDFTWMKVREKLSSLDHSRVFVKGLGTFIVKPKSLIDQIKFTESMIQKYGNAKLEHYLDNDKYQYYLKYQKDLDMMLKLKEKLDTEKVRREELYKKRKEYGNRKDLEEQKEDSGGNQELSNQE